jgi:hypothetical protein
MPLPQPQFNNEIDPCLPQVIKPELYSFDEYQRCDLIFFAKPGVIWPYYVLTRYGYDIPNVGTSARYLCIYKTDGSFQVRESTRIDGDIDRTVYPTNLQLIDYFQYSDGFFSSPDSETARFYDRLSLLLNDFENIENWEISFQGSTVSGFYYLPFIPKKPKQYLYTVSPYQLSIENGSGGWLGIMYSVPEKVRTILIERFYPSKESWCSGYAQKLFNFSVQNWPVYFSGINQPEGAETLQVFGSEINNSQWNFFRSNLENKDIDFNSDVEGEITINGLMIENESNGNTFTNGALSPEIFLIRYSIKCLVKKGSNKINLKKMVRGSLICSPNTPQGLIDILTQNKMLYSQLDIILNESLETREGVLKGVVANNSPKLVAANNNRWDEINFIENDINSNKTYQNIPVYSLERTNQQYYRTNSRGEYRRVMPDSVRTVEIHKALNAAKFASDNGRDRIANLGFYIEFISQILGGSFNPDGTTRSIRQMKRLKDGSVVPAGWDRAQFSVNERGKSEGQEGGNRGEFAPGIVYEQRTNKLSPDRFNPEKSQIEGGDLVLCENLPQYLEAFIWDLTKALGMPDLGATAIPNADGSKNIALFEGLSQQIAELLFMISTLSIHTSKTHISANITQAVVKEILVGLGLPLQQGVISFETGDTDNALVPYPSIANNSPSLTQQLGWVLMNLGHLNAASVTE